MVHKLLQASIENLGPRTIRAVCSTGEVDLMGEVIEQPGIDLSRYRQNPIVLFSHRPECPVGIAKNVRVENGRLMAEIEFAPKGLSQIADETCGLVKAGIVKGISVGITPLEAQPMDPSRPRGPQRYLRSVLDELSLVALPANTGAQVYDKALPPADLTKAERLARAASLGLYAPKSATKVNNNAVQQGIEHCRAVDAARLSAGHLTRDERIAKANAFRDRSQDYR